MDNYLYILKMRTFPHKKMYITVTVTVLCINYCTALLVQCLLQIHNVFFFFLITNTRPTFGVHILPNLEPSSICLASFSLSLFIFPHLHQVSEQSSYLLFIKITHAHQNTHTKPTRTSDLYH